jgi:hypothetical protein
MALL